MNQQELTEEIKSFVARDRGNFVPGSQIHIFDAPLVRIARAEDPYFERLQADAVVGPHHRLPSDWLPGARSVLSYFLPISRQICETNRAGPTCSEEWMYARFHGELFNDRLRRLITELLHSKGHAAIAPALDTGYMTENMNSNWSERHVAFIAGLGTFGLNRGFITDEGMAGRIGSVVTDLALEASPRSYTDHNEYCLHFQDGSCGECVSRCPAGALDLNGKDRVACSTHIQKVEGSGIRAKYGFPYAPCGKCYVDVPCERKRP